MAINYEKMQQEMIAGIKNKMLAISPNAQPADFQQQFVKAVAIGLQNNLKTAQIIGVTPAPIMAGLGQGMTINANTMVSVGVSTMIGFTGGKQGVALKPMMEGLFTPIEEEFKQATIQSISGFGGQGSGLMTVTMASLAPLILAQLPPKIQANLATSNMGMNFIKAISAGIAAGLNAGVPGIVPFGTVPPPVGLLIGLVS